jgi:hypothetical protein
MLAKSGLISQREHLPRVSIAVVLQRPGFHSAGGGLQLAVIGRRTQYQSPGFLIDLNLALSVLSPASSFESVSSSMLPRGAALHR